MKIRQINMLMGGLLPLAMAVSGCSHPTQADMNPPAQGAALARGLERVAAGPPVRKPLVRETTQPGWIDAYEQAPLYSKLNGYVGSFHADIGDRVSKGQTLAKLFVPELKDEVVQKEARVAQAEAEYVQAEAALTAARAATKTAQARLAGVEAGLIRATGDYERWNAEYNRLKELAERGTVTEKLVDETRNQLSAAEAARAEALAAIESARAAVEEAQAFVTKAEADKGAADARRNVAKADLAYAKTMLRYTEIKAPFDGVVTTRNVDTGHFVSTVGSGNAAPLFVVARMDTVRVFLDVPEVEAEMVDAGSDNGDPAAVTVQALGNRTFEGIVTRTSWSLNPASRSLRVEIDLPNPDGALRPGMYATVRLQLAQRHDVLTLPATAIVREGLETMCCLVKEGKIVRQPVQLGLRAGAEYEVVSGVSAGDTVVLTRAGSLKAGQPVEVIPPQ